MVMTGLLNVGIVVFMTVALVVALRVADWADAHGSRFVAERWDALVWLLHPPPHHHWRTRPARR
jgi:hypothetical protein